MGDFIWMKILSNHDYWITKKEKKKCVPRVMRNGTDWNGMRAWMPLRSPSDPLILFSSWALYCPMPIGSHGYPFYQVHAFLFDSILFILLKLSP